MARFAATSGDCLAGSMSVMWRAPSVGLQTLESTEPSPTFMRLVARSLGKGHRACAACVGTGAFSKDRLLAST